MPPPSPETAEIIRRKKAQYCRFVDTKQWSRFPEIALPTAKLTFFEPGMVPLGVGKKKLLFDSLQPWIDHVSKGLANMQSVHVIGLDELEQTAPDEVKAIFCMRDDVKMDRSLGLVWSVGGGHYHEIWRRKGDDWFLEELRLERLLLPRVCCFCSSRFSSRSWNCLVCRFSKDWKIPVRRKCWT